MKPQFKPGKNLAMKVPVHEFEQTVVFYRDILGFEEIKESQSANSDSVRFMFGNKILWIDRVETLSQAELWLEIITDDIEAASEYLANKGCVRRDEIEPLPQSFKGFWLANPANIIHLVSADDSE